MQKVNQLASGEIVITLDGNAVENLRRAADAMNRVDWCSRDNTAVSLVEAFVLPCAVGDWESDVETATDFVADGIDTETEDADEDGRRRDALRAAFAAAFGLRQST